MQTTRSPHRHPFRAGIDLPQPSPYRRTDSDWKLFLLSFAAFFTCFSAFLL